MEKFIGLKRIKENNDPKDIPVICDSLREIIKLIIDHPNDESKRCIQLDSLETLMSYSGGMETLFEIGFIEVILILCSLFSLFFSRVKLHVLE